MIKITEEWHIDADSRQFILKRRKIAGDDAKEPGKAYYVDEGYYPTIDTLIRGLSDRKLYEAVSSCERLRDAQEELVDWASRLRTPLVSELKEAVRRYEA